MSLELFAQHVRQQIENYNHRNEQAEIIIAPEEIKIPKNPFLSLKDIYNDAIPSVHSDKFYSISFIGSQGKGKTFSARVIATLAELDGFLVIYGKAEDFLQDQQGWIDEVKERIKNHGKITVCFVLDDMSYSTAMVSAKKAAGFKHFVADIRHVLEPVLGDIEILMVYISHRLHSLPPMLRNSGTWVFGSALPEDRADAIKLIPKLKEERERLDDIFQFLQKISSEGPKNDIVHYVLGDNRFDFKWGKKEDPGDGRLMMVSHAGEMKILQSKGIADMIDLEQRRILPKPKVEVPEETEEDIRKKAMQMFPVTEEIPPDPFKILKRDILPINNEYQHEIS